MTSRPPGDPVEDPRFADLARLQGGLARILDSPAGEGRLEMIVRRPDNGAREVLTRGELSVEKGLVGDNWATRGSRQTPDGSPHPDMQLNLMNSRVIELIAGERERWKLAGDQLFLDLDLTPVALPVGTRLSIGNALIEVTAPPHLGCRKFVDRFGVDAMKFVSSAQGRALNLRGVNARVVRPGVIRAGDLVRRVSPAQSQ